MKTMEIKTCNHRAITILVDITRKNIDASVNAVVSVMEEIILCELYRIMGLNDNRIFCDIKIPTYYNGKRKTYYFQFPIVKNDMIINEVWKIDFTLRLEVERDLLRNLLK